MRRRVLISNWVAVFSALTGFVAIMFMVVGWPATYVPPKYESTGPGTIVYYNSTTRQLLFENDKGFQKMLHPICSSEVPVWTHMKTNMMFRWAPYKRWSNGTGPAYGEECFEIIGIQRLDIGQKEHPYVLVGHFQ